MDRVLTTCIYCGCGCGLYLTSCGNKLIGAYPSQNHPVSKSALCVKGWNCYEFVNSLERLSTPLIKRKGKFIKASWDQALDLIVSKFKRFKKDFGPDSLAFLSSAKTTNEENYLMMKLARAVFKTNNVDHCARLCHSSTVAGLAATFGSGAMTNSIDDFDNAEVVLVTGSDTTEQHPLIASRIINSLDKGTSLIVIDPRRIELAKYASVYAQPRYGTDVAWINAMMNVIISEDLHAKEYIAQRTEGFEELKEMVKGYTPEYAQKICGIDKDILIKAARIYAKARRAMIVYAMGITQHTTGVDNVKSLANLAMLTAHVGFASCGVNPLRGQNNVQGACDVGALPDVYCGYQAVSDRGVKEKFQKAWGTVGLCDTLGLTVTEIIKGLGKGTIKGLYIMGENPALSDPDTNHVRRCLESAEFLVVQDIFLSETAEFADVVLPAASFAEKDGTFTNTDRRVQRIRKVIPPFGKARADWQIICEIAKRCGYKGMDYTSPSQVMDEIASLSPIYAGISYQRLDPFGLQWPCPSKEHPGTTYLHKDKFTRGRGLFLPRPYIPANELPDQDYPFLLTTGRTYWHWHTGTMTRRTSTLDREVPCAYAEVNPKDAQRLEVKNGDSIKVSSRRGSIQLQVKVTQKVDVGSIFIPFHFKEAPANVLTNPALDPVAKIPEYKVCAVKIEKP